MKNYLKLMLLVIAFPAFGQTDTSGQLADVLAFQQKMNGEFEDPETSPLKEEQQQEFESLDFYPVNLNYRVVAKIARVEKQKIFKMKTTTDREPEYVKFAEASFTLMGKECKINIYQNVALREQEKYRNSLFLPFTDLTNGEETYGGGRYIDLEIPEGEEIIIDFNKAYNPYCAYNSRYSCPVPPKENFINMKISAGVKMFEY
ncbi:MAG: DUF1684 domain-containing protein [Bacteroidia bacterium]